MTNSIQLYIKCFRVALIVLGLIVVNGSFAQVKFNAGIMQKMQQDYNKLKKPEVSFKKFAQINMHVYEKAASLSSANRQGILSQHETYCNNVKPYCTGGDFESGLDQSQYTGAYGTWFGGIYPDPFSLTYGFSSGSLSSSSAHQTVVDTSDGVDPYTDIKLAPPNGGAKSLRLGNDVSGYGTELIAKTIVVDPNETILKFYYAVVFEDPGHPFQDQPAFSVRAYDCADGTELTGVADLGNGSNVVVSDANNPFFQSRNFGSIAFRDWSVAQVDLSAHVGKTVIIIFTNKDCGFGGHFGYTYLDNLFSSQCPVPGDNATPPTQGSIKINSADTCGVGQVCVKYNLPNKDSSGTTITGDAQITLFVYQNSQLVDSILSPVLTEDSIYCFAINPAQLNIDQNTDFDYILKGKFSLQGFPLAPQTIGNPPTGIVNNINNDYHIACNNNGCNKPTFLDDPTIVLNATCGNNDGNISIIPQSGSAPYMYSIDGGATYVAGPDGGSTFLNLAPGTYHLRIKDANGCESDPVEKIVGTQGTGPTFINDGTIVLDATCGNSDGNISIIPSSGTPPFMYSIDGGATFVAGPDAGYTFINLGAGTYNLVLKDANGCQSEVVERTVNENCPRSTASTAGRGRITPETATGGKELISAYPSPSRGVFRVQLQNYKDDKAEVFVFDSKGTLVQKKQLNLVHNSAAEFNISSRAPGLYYVKVVSKNGTKTSTVLLQK